MADKDLQTPEKVSKKEKGTKKPGWTIVGIVILFIVITGVGFSGYMINQSNTNPEFCATCHIMQKNVASYMTSHGLDNVHEQANVECTDCHHYPLSSKVDSGIKFVTGNYTVNENGDLFPVSYDNDICLNCHISYEHVAVSTDFLFRNPHNNHNGELECKTCHISHGDQIDFCSTCHDNGNQRMIDHPIQPRGTISQN